MVSRAPRAVRVKSRAPRSFSSAAMRLETACWGERQLNGSFLEPARVRDGDEGAHGIEIHAQPR
jgi:hypothetical protein